MTRTWYTNKAGNNADQHIIIDENTGATIIYRIAEFGDLIVYERGKWHRREHLPKYLVSRESTGRDLEEFRRKSSALNWAQRQAEANT